MKKNLTAVIALVLFTSSITSCGGSPTPVPIDEPVTFSGHIELAGSIKVGPLAEALGKAFTVEYPDIKIEVSGGGSREGVISTGERIIDIGLTSRDIKEAEYEEFPYLVAHTIAFDSIAIVTNPDIPLKSLSIEQVKDIFAGEITNFHQVGGPDAPISVISHLDDSVSRITFQDLVMEFGEIDKSITENALVRGSNELVRTTLSATPNTIGYLPIRFLDESTHPVPIDDVTPSVANIHNGTYEIVRPFNMVTYGPPEGLLKTFLDWIKSEEGQAIVSEQYITIFSEDE
jgi:phosphate transport system substrate-binding protein